MIRYLYKAASHLVSSSMLQHGDTPVTRNHHRDTPPPTLICVCTLPKTHTGPTQNRFIEASQLNLLRVSTYPPLLTAHHAQSIEHSVGHVSPHGYYVQNTFREWTGCKHRWLPGMNNKLELFQWVRTWRMNIFLVLVEGLSITRSHEVFFLGNVLWKRRFHTIFSSGCWRGVVAWDGSL